ncbi:hypothetical protein [Sinisalibacter aestuarii]|uniref:Type IV pilus biogenesis protein PilP n=1 Tax=Sinisalibacter aestuarii TaxID=2949426 RepID=A0ABQ5LUQ7_9RHOB|nr:hypothetical protein [Sinisalibacter aestuarii]GKY88722.1 hypothetical protein STA1M1_25910 [Sinisalibacter aestuarii]
MKPNFALDLSHEGINLLHRSKGGWTLVGSVALDDPNLSSNLEELRRSAAMLESGGFTTKVIVPNSQILYTTLAAPGPDDIAREVQIRAALDGLTPYPVGDLVFDWRAQGDEARVAVLARETMDEAEAFAADYKFNPVSFVARPPRGEFSGEPFFGKTRAATRLLAPGERIEPDASPVPQNPKAKELPAEARIDTPQDDMAPPAPEPAPEPEPVETPAAPGPDLDDPFAELDKLAAELSGDGETGAAADPAPKTPPRPKRKADDTPRVAAPVLAPFPPTPDDESSKPRPFMPQPEAKAKPAKPKPAPKADEPRFVPPAPPADEAITEDTASVAPGPTESDTGPSEPVPSFSSIRHTDDSKAGNDASANRLAGLSPRIGAVDTDDDADSAAPRIPPAPVPSHDRIRAGMADALSKPLPRPGKSPEPEPKGSGLFARLSGSASTAAERAGTAMRDRNARRTEEKAAAAEARAAEAAQEAAVAEARPAPEPKPPKPERKGRFGLKRPPTEADTRRSREAEAMTVFGARRAQTTTSRPKYLGLILTLVLLLLMAAIALWSTFLVDDGEVSLFNPGPGVATETADAEALPTPEDEAVADEGAEAVFANTAEVLSPEAAEARYAATGIWQRAPDAPSPPESTRLDQLDIAGLAPVEPSRPPASLPEPADGGLREAALADPVPPPPPGTTFDLDADGLVVATPEGALSPAGILVYSGRPAVVPPAPPAGLFPEAITEPAPDPAAEIVPEAETEAEAADAQPIAALDIPRTRPRARPADLVPPPAEEGAVADGTTPDGDAQLLRPNARPDDALPETDTAAIDAAIEDVVQAALVNPTELAVVASAVPSHRPSNFATIVDSAMASASDGSAVVAASAPAAAAATVTPAIPTSASVATRATTENALNLREINLIGIYGSSNSRRALVRLKTGRYVKVEVGDRLDGGQVTSISANRLTYQKGSRTYALEVLPLG